jgi:ketosteroid isomerase-like protein
MDTAHGDARVEDDTARNTRLVRRAFDRLAEGDGSAFLDLMADDFCWTITGGTWAGTWRGKRAVRRELLAPLFAQFADTYTNTAQRIIAQDDWVVIECQGRVTTTAGARYDNTYCYVCRFDEGQLRELREYCDTQLIATVLLPPPAAS